MATTLLHQLPHHFSPPATNYTPGTFDFHPVQQSPSVDPSTVVSTSIGNQQIGYTSPQRWAAQQVFHRRTSKSPNVRDRTPIRHNRPDMSRHRSSSRSEVLLAYAAEQARQIQQGQIEGARAMFAPSMEPPAQSYQSQSYGYPSVASPYMSQQPYFDPQSNSGTYSQLAPHPSASANAGMYAMTRHESQIPQTPGTTLDTADTLYSQPRAPQLPSMTSVPSNFPPIPQPLESTPNELDIVGSRQKPQCWDHGCNGRQFSTFSNLLRHQREKSGTATKARCPHCGTEFTRTTARNGHLYGGKCKGMPDQNQDESKETKDEVP